MLEMTRTDPEWKDKIITGYETWVYGYDPETKHQSAEWRCQDIAPNDFFLFPKLKAVLKGRHFDTRDDIIEKSPLALKSIPKGLIKTVSTIGRNDGAAGSMSTECLAAVAKRHKRKDFEPSRSIFQQTCSSEEEDDPEPLDLSGPPVAIVKSEDIENIDVPPRNNSSPLGKTEVSSDSFVSNGFDTASSLSQGSHEIFRNGEVALKNNSYFTAERILPQVETFGNFALTIAETFQAPSPLHLRPPPLYQETRHFEVFSPSVANLGDYLKGPSPPIEEDSSLLPLLQKDKDVLNFRKVCARWIPRLHSENHKPQRIKATRVFLEMNQRDGDQLFSRIVTGDESWVHHSTPETKRQSMVWKKPEESAPKKAKVTISAGKVMAIVFWDCKGVLLVDYLPPNTTVNAARYCEFLTKLRAAIKRETSWTFASESVTHP
ncbi:hypothetical protein LAZ67_3004143 [Cordylochernes scorpioides]|uniref:Transposase n=1 Tax=Cordylochernes scorpioides TaxID=51811 RepID=A0ABY6KAF3_9ARAC|nr:hypothetical protein LAZ67_3004143 [Cordylochernes scorpioides]